QIPRVHFAAPEFAEYGHAHYGLGFRTHAYRGERVVWHGGGWSGWGTLMTMLPGGGGGGAVFTNRTPSLVPGVVANQVFDRVCGKEPIPWFDRFRERRRKCWRSSRSTDRPGSPRGGPTPGRAATWPTMPATTTIPVTAGSPSATPTAAWSGR